MNLKMPWAEMKVLIRDKNLIKLEQKKNRSKDSSIKEKMIATI